MKLKALVGLAAVAAPVMAFAPVGGAVAHATTCSYPPGKATLTLSATKSAVAPGDKVELSGTLTVKGGCVISGAGIHLLKDGIEGHETQTDDNGIYTFKIHPYQSHNYRTVFDGNAKADQAFSDNVTITVVKKKHH